MLKISEEKHVTILSIIIILITLTFLSSILALVSISDILDPLPPSRFPRITSRVLFFISVFLCGAIFLAGKKLFNPIIKLSNLKIIIILFCISIILSMPLLLLTDINPISDFGRYYSLAKALNQNGDIDSPFYVASFPHIIIFPSILSIIFRLFGSSVLIAQLTGIVFSSLSVVLVFLIGIQLADKQHAFFSAILWLFMPTRIFFTLLISTENVFNAFALFTIFLFLKAVHSNHLKTSIIYFIMTGILFAFVTALRPNGLIILIACLLLYLFFFEQDERLIFYCKPILKYLVCIIIIIMFLLMTSFINFTVEKIINMDTATNRLGWNFFIGMNKDSKGSWNTEDNTFFRELLNEKGPIQTQIIFFSFGLERLDNLIKNKELIPLLISKTTNMWYANRDGFDLVSWGQEKNLYQQIDLYKNHKYFITVSNGYYYVTILLSLISLAKAITHKEWNAITILSCLIILGTVALQLPFEVQMRYKNHALIWLGFLAAECRIPILKLFESSTKNLNL